MWTLWQQFKAYFPWTVLPYMWQPSLLELENRWRVRLAEKDKQYENLNEAWRRDYRNQQAFHNAVRESDQRALLIADLLDSLGIETDSEITNVSVCSDGGGERSRISNVDFTKDGINRSFHVVAVDLTPVNAG